MSDRHRPTSNAYVPPAKRVKTEKFEVGTVDHQKLQWDENKKKINGLINRANASNIAVIIKELFNCNLIRYKGILVNALLKAQELSPTFTEVYAALTAVINSRIKTIGLLLAHRLVLQYKLAVINDNKPKCLTTIKFIAHLINQNIMHEVIAFQLTDHLLDKPTPFTLELAIAFVKECGAKLEELDPQRLSRIFKIFRDATLENEFDTRTHDLIDLIHDIRKDNFRNFPAIRSGLDLIEIDDQNTHEIEMDGVRREDFHMEYNYFKFDPKWVETEAKYENFRNSLLDDDGSTSGSESSDAESGEDDETNDRSDSKEDDKSEVLASIKSEATGEQKIIDETGGDLIAFRRKVYLTIRSSVTAEEVVHMLLKSGIKPELHSELCQMIIDCCGQDRTYQPIYGRVASKLCQINRRAFAPKFEQIFVLFYETIHKYETNKIRNIAVFYSHLLITESIDWNCLSCMKLREDATTSAGRCFIKFLFLDLAANLSMPTLLEYIRDPSKQNAFKDLFPKDQEQDIRFAINFFTCSDLGQLTDDLRKELLSRQ